MFKNVCRYLKHIDFLLNYLRVYTKYHCVQLNFSNLYNGIQLQLYLFLKAPINLQHVLITTIFAPSDILQPFVKAFAISHRVKAGEYKVLPDTCIVIGFQCSGKHYFIDNGQSILLGAA
jgi:hypothetical protein